MSHPSRGRLAELTRTAVVRAAALTGRVDTAAHDAPLLAALLYRAGGCAPDARLDPRWAAHVVTAAERTARAGLGGHPRTPGRHWHSWTSTGADPTTLVHKIYVSPAVADVAPTLGVILTHAPLLGVPAWKVGADLPGLHRPDKIVLYLASAERADRVASALALALGGVAPQGVPFSGQVGLTGIVSRGRDVGGTSWRADVCRQVAESLCASRAALGTQAGAAEVADHALAQLAGRGLDVATWHPSVPGSPVSTGAAPADRPAASLPAASLPAASLPAASLPAVRVSPAARAAAALPCAPGSGRHPRLEVSCS
jgi:rhodanese-related sulfurtransferase